jgi:hypothetical protein
LPSNLITQEHIENALRKQRRLRMAAAIATSLLAPLETYAASALPASHAAERQRGGSNSAPACAMSEEELGDTSAQGLSDDLVNAVKDAKA